MRESSLFLLNASLRWRWRRRRGRKRGFLYQGSGLVSPWVRIIWPICTHCCSGYRNNRRIPFYATYQILVSLYSYSALATYSCRKNISPEKCTLIMLWRGRLDFAPDTYDHDFFFFFAVGYEMQIKRILWFMFVWEKNLETGAINAACCNNINFKRTAEWRKKMF